MKKYLVVIEETGAGYSAYSPDLPGCVTNGWTRHEAEHRLWSAMRVHLEQLKENGETVPEPHTETTYLELPV